MKTELEKQTTFREILDKHLEKNMVHLTSNELHTIFDACEEYIASQLPKSEVIGKDCINCPSNQFYLANTERIMDNQEGRLPSSEVSDEDIKKWARIEAFGDISKKRFKEEKAATSIAYFGYTRRVDGAKAMRDGNIKPTIKREKEELCDCSDGGKYLDGAYDTHCDRCKKHLR